MTSLKGEELRIYNYPNKGEELASLRRVDLQAFPKFPVGGDEMTSLKGTDLRDFLKCTNRRRRLDVTEKKKGGAKRSFQASSRWRE